MSLYLQIAVGAGLYLIEATHALEICDEGRGAATTPVVDLRALFAEPVEREAQCVLVGQANGATAALMVDRVGALMELEDAEFCPLPPIGPVGLLIDAVSTRLADGRPLLRLRGELALTAAAAG